MSKARVKGTSWEVELLPRLRLLFGSHVERAPLKGTADKGDFTGVPWLVEAKNTIRPNFLEWARTARKKVGDRFWVVWKGDRRTPGNGPYVLMPLELAEELAEAWMDHPRQSLIPPARLFVADL